MTYEDQFIDDFLEHHGIKGMHWGIRHDPKQKQDRREARAKKFVDKANKYQGEIDKTRASTNHFRLKPKYVKISELKNKKDQALSDAQKKREGKLSKRQKQVLIGASAAAVILASYVTYQSIQSGNARRLIGKGKDFVLQKHSATPWKYKPELADKNLDANGIMTKVVSHINPTFKNNGTGSKMNCRRATFAYEMRRRGYDVQATRTTTGSGQNIAGMFNALHPKARQNLAPTNASGIFARVMLETRKKDKPFTDLANSMPNVGRNRVPVDKIFQTLSLHPDGSRGELGVVWRGGGAHSLAWEKVHGVIEIFDTQTGHRYTPQDINKLPMRITEAGFTRLDNLPINEDFLRRWLKDA